MNGAYDPNRLVLDIQATLGRAGVPVVVDAANVREAVATAAALLRSLGVLPLPAPNPGDRVPADAWPADRCPTCGRAVDALPTLVLDGPEGRRLLAKRDVAGVFRLLHKHGLSQRRIAALTRQSQSEVSEILAGRHVVAYDVLCRIADGLGVPRGRMGLAYDPEATEALDAREEEEDLLDDQ